MFKLCPFRSSCCFPLEYEGMKNSCYPSTLGALVCNLFNVFKRRQPYRTVERCRYSSVGGGWAVLVSEIYFGCNTSRCLSKKVPLDRNAWDKLPGFRVAADACGGRSEGALPLHFLCLALGWKIVCDFRCTSTSCHTFSCCSCE